MNGKCPPQANGLYMAVECLGGGTGLAEGGYWK